MTYHRTNCICKICLLEMSLLSLIPQVNLVLMIPDCKLEFFGVMESTAKA